MTLHSYSQTSESGVTPWYIDVKDIESLFIMIILFKFKSAYSHLNTKMEGDLGAVSVNTDSQ